MTAARTVECGRCHGTGDSPSGGISNCGLCGGRGYIVTSATDCKEPEVDPATMPRRMAPNPERNHYQDAIDVQDACNLSGVARSFVQAIDWVRKQPEYAGSEYERKHPIIVMFVSKLASMVDVETMEAFGKAYAACKDEARKRGGRG